MSKKMMEDLTFPASWTDEQVKYAYEAINSHDSLTKEVERLREALNQLSNAESEAVRNHVKKALEGGDE